MSRKYLDVYEIGDNNVVFTIVNPQFYDETLVDGVQLSKYVDKYYGPKVTIVVPIGPNVNVQNIKVCADISSYSDAAKLSLNLKTDIDSLKTEKQKATLSILICNCICN